MVIAPDFVQQMMSSPVVHVSPDDSVADALRKMIDGDIGAVVVVDDGRPVGCSRSGTCRAGSSTIANCWFEGWAT
jgi:predicted transcriptional regulator